MKYSKNKIYYYIYVKIFNNGNCDNEKINISFRIITNSKYKILPNLWLFGF